MSKRFGVVALVILLASCSTGGDGTATSQNGLTRVTLMFGSSVATGAISTAPPSILKSITIRAVASNGSPLGVPVTAQSPNFSVSINIPNGNGIQIIAAGYTASGEKSYEGKSESLNLTGIPISVTLRLNLSIGITPSATQVIRKGTVDLFGTVATLSPPASSPLIWEPYAEVMPLPGDLYGSRQRWSAPDVPGTYTVTARIDPTANIYQDRYTVGTVNIQVLNRAPLLSLSATSTQLVQGTKNTAVQASATDPDSDTVTYQLTGSNPSWASINPNSGIITLDLTNTTAAAGSSYSVMVIARDQYNLASTSIKLPITVVATDIIPPVVTPPADIYVEATGPTGVTASEASIVTFLADVYANDNVGVTSLTNDAPGSFPIGSTLVTFTAFDAQGNSATASATVIVRDTTPPLITLTGVDPYTIEAGHVYADAGATFSDMVDGTGLVTATGSVNSVMPGTYVLTYDYTDTYGNAAIQMTRTVNVVDTTLPVITLNGISPVSIDAGTIYIDQYATVTDNVDATNAFLDGYSTVNTAQPGSYSVTYSYTDSSGNSAVPVVRSVVVVDVTPPAITAPADLFIAATDIYGVASSDPYVQAFLNGATAVDSFDGPVTAMATNVPVQFPTGSRQITFSASDAAGNTSQAYATVIVTSPGAVEQVIYPQLQDQYTLSGGSVSVPLNYGASDGNALLTGLGLRIHFDSTLLTFAGFNSSLALGKLGESVAPMADTADLDGDPATDSYLLMAWVDLFGTWPAGTLPVMLVEPLFTSAGGVVTPTLTRLNIMATSTAAGYGFAATAAQIWITP